MKKQPTVLLISQVFFPDTPAVGQHLYDLARELSTRGLRVVVLTPRRGYEDPGMRFAKREAIGGIEVRRLPLCAFGKSSIPLRLLGGVSLVLQGMIRGICVRGLSHVLVSTAPPMSSLAAIFIKTFRRSRFMYWVMDLNPDQMIASGKLCNESWIGWIGHRIQRYSLNRADLVVALDEYMAERLKQRANLEGKLMVIPPWPFEDQFADIPHDKNPFRQELRLADRFMVMYSGNITDVHPLDTLLEAIIRLNGDERFVFFFVGAQSARKRIECFAAEKGLKNVVTMGYVPLKETKFSLSAADLHVVTMGNNMVGVVHPCKVYGILSVGRPILAIGPKKSHIGEILDAAPVGWLVEHGDVNGVVRVIRQAMDTPLRERLALGVRGRELVKKMYSRGVLCRRFGDLFEAGVHPG